jgi:hypothetical protein
VDLWWVPVGLAAWFLVAVAIGLCIGRVLRRCSQVRESIDRSGGRYQMGTSRPGKQPASEGWLSTGAGGGEPVLDAPPKDERQAS